MPVLSGTHSLFRQESHAAQASCTHVRRAGVYLRSQTQPGNTHGSAEVTRAMRGEKLLLCFRDGDSAGDVEPEEGGRLKAVWKSFLALRTEVEARDLE